MCSGLRMFGTASRSTGCLNSNGCCALRLPMLSSDFWINRAVVFASAVVYWVGVFLQARRVRHRIGRSPNVQPRGPKEKLLWAGWILVVLVWLTLPFVAGAGGAWIGWRCLPALCGPAGRFLGVILIIAGYAGTLWCYAAM